MRFLKWVIILCALFALYWVGGHHLFSNGLRDWLAAQERAGRMAQVQDLTTGGFPADFAADGKGVLISDPASGWGWMAEGAHVSVPAWWPFRVNAQVTGRQVIDTPTGQIDLLAEGMAGHVGLNATLAPVSGELTSGPIHAATAQGTLRADDLRIGSDRTEGRTHRLTADANGLAVEAGDIRLGDGRLHLIADVTLAEVVEGLADAVAVPVDALRIEAGELRLGDMAVQISGDLVSDGRGFAAGDLTLRMENWPAALKLAVDTGVLPAGQARTLEGGFRLMAGGGDALNVPLSLDGGMIRLGPLPLGPAPRFR
ncbi:DUF2125 domain-containing protein [Falsirhodobacter halotolerans]|uniref:DUF2125 domain-containing protein n=1 Tax=Falsirhodobacter halotolerans TaxID=1146892 RepID=UPI001FD4B9FD|nr:DUF2125 domain-containing protein [Falsirhodobacter halotolerans]MCJ8138718.1 DUF2125 domain-containing protein [Falsirhodobacter halotolerans]